VAPTDLERLRARGLDLSRRKLLAAQRPEPAVDAPVDTTEALPALAAEGGR
jgi:hypothetical protein